MNESMFKLGDLVTRPRHNGDANPDKFIVGRVNSVFDQKLSQGWQDQLLSQSPSGYFYDLHNLLRDGIGSRAFTNIPENELQKSHS